MRRAIGSPAMRIRVTLLLGLVSLTATGDARAQITSRGFSPALLAPAVAVFDTADRTFTGSFAARGDHVVTSPDGRLAYVVDSFMGQLTVVAVATQTVVTTVAIPNLTTVAFAPDG